MRDVELYQILLGLTPPWRVTAVEVDPPTPARKLGEITVKVEHPSGELLHCPECEAVMARYDSRPRKWRHLNTMQWKTFVEAQVPRGECPEHGIRQVRVPWAEDSSRFTAMFEAFTIDVLLSVRSKVQAEFLTDLSWDQVDRVMEREQLGGSDAIVFPHIHCYGLDLAALLCGQRRQKLSGRRKSSLSHNLNHPPAVEIAKHRGVVMTLSKAFLVDPEVAQIFQLSPLQPAFYLPNAEIIHDKFHVMRELTRAVDLVRKQEHRENKKSGKEELLKKSKYVWLKSPANWTDTQREKFESLKVDILKVGRAWSIKEAFQGFWEYLYAGSARKFFDRWFFWATHSRLKPIIEAARTLKRHLAGLLAYCRHRITNAVAEGMNSKIQLIKANARGFRNFENYRSAILFHCGGLSLYPHKTR